MNNTAVKLQILEDNQSHRFLFEEHLVHKFDYQFHTSIKELEDFMHEATDPQLIIADLKLPDGSFYHYFSKNLQDTPHKFLFVSECTDLDVLRNSLSYENVCDYLTKPVNRSELVVKIENIVNKFFPKEDHIINKALSTLSNKERLIFATIAQKPNRQIKRTELIDEIWKDTKVVPKTLDVHLSNMRSKLSPHGVSISFENNTFELKFNKPTQNLDA